MSQQNGRKKITCVIGYLLRPAERKVCLARQMRKIGEGLRKGPGGKFEPDKHDGLLACLAEEMLTEINVHVDFSTVKEVGLLRFDNLDQKMPIVKAYVYTFESPDEPQDSEECKPEWFPYDGLPDDMPESDKFWLPMVLRGKLVAGKVRYCDSSLRRIDHMNIRDVPRLPEDVR